MKFALLSLAILASCTGLRAQTWAELTLPDGRVLRDVKFVSQSPDSIMVRHAEGLAQLKKRQLPPELQKQYPVDFAAARQQARAQAAAKDELIRQKEISDNRTRYEYETRRNAERAVLIEKERETAKLEAAKQVAREKGEMKGDLLIRMGPARAKSVVLNATNLGDTSATFDWREIQVTNAKGDRLPVSAAMPVDAGKRPDFIVDPQQTRSFELVFGAFEGGGPVALGEIRWKP